MKLLAIETATLLGGMAIMDESEGLIAESRLNVKATYSERLMVEVDHMLKQSGLSLDRIDAFAVSVGPGSFTGLRIGLSTVKGFAFVSGRPVISVPTLEAMAWNLAFSRYPVCTMLDARKKEVYAALFVLENGEIKRIMCETSIGAEQLLKKIQSDAPEQKIVFAGEGALLYEKLITDTIADRAVFAPPEKMTPSAAAVAALGMKKALRGEFSEPIGLVPFYIRRSEAEIKRDG
ncbi:MAG: tRNA (adenosine(37)-N6)-threonylcarbamoyltransferase complex dimerization subunit type 1 TsaB [Nitrospirota bacterium]